MLSGWKSEASYTCAEVFCSFSVAKIIGNYLILLLQYFSAIALCISSIALVRNDCTCGANMLYIRIIISLWVWITGPSVYLVLQVCLFPEVCYVSDIYYLKCTLIQLVLQWVCWSSDILILKYSSVQLDFSLYLPGVLFLSPYVPLPTSLLHSFSHLMYIHTCSLILFGSYPIAM